AIGVKVSRAATALMAWSVLLLTSTSGSKPTSENRPTTGDRWPMISLFRTMTRSRGAAEGRNTWASKRPSSVCPVRGARSEEADTKRAVIRLMTYPANASMREDLVLINLVIQKADRGPPFAVPWPRALVWGRHAQTTAQRVVARVPGRARI